MSCRRRRIYEDRDARISILAPGNTASEMRPDTLPQTVHPPSTIPLHTRGGPYIATYVLTVRAERLLPAEAALA